jgi:hypothetical protein
MLEFATSESRAIDAEAWIDPEVVGLAGINAEELRRYKNPPAFASKDGKVTQPPRESFKLPMSWPRGDRILQMTDEEVTRTMSESTPPVPAKEKAA